MDEKRVREGMETRLELARLFRKARAGSKYVKNLSAAARAAGITPSYLHRIEGAETLASPDRYVALCELYDLPTSPILAMLGRLDSGLQARLAACIETHYELLELVLSLPQELVPAANEALSGVAHHGRQESTATGCAARSTQS